MVAGWIVKVDAATTVVVVDLCRGVTWASPIWHPIGLQAPQGSVEYIVRDQQSVVLAWKLHARLRVIEVDSVIEMHTEEGPPCSRFGQPQQRGQERSRAVAISGRDGEMVEPDGHSVTVPHDAAVAASAGISSCEARSGRVLEHGLLQAGQPVGHAVAASLLLGPEPVEGPDANDRRNR